nr:hypothetical protein [uncultured Clostridium sp.]
MTIKGFTKIENSILFNSNLSLQARVIYAQINYYSNIPNFKLSKSLILKDSGLSVNTFDKIIKELKEAELIVLNTERKGKKNIYWYCIKEKSDKKKSGMDSKGEIPADEQINIDEALQENKVIYITGVREKQEIIKKSKQMMIDNHENVRLARSVVNIDASKFDKEILSMASTEFVRSTIKKFKNIAKNKKDKSFYTAKTLRNILIQEYYDNRRDFPIGMLKKLNAVEEIPLKQYSELRYEIELRKALDELENDDFVYLNYK